MTTEPAEAGQRQPGDLGQQILGSQQLYDLLVSKISDAAVERMEAQHSRTRNRTAIFLTILLTLFITSLTGIATFGFNALQESIKDQAVTEADRAATEATKEAVKATASVATEAIAQAVPNPHFSQPVVGLSVCEAKSRIV